MQCVKEFSNANNTYSPIELGGADQHLEGTWVPVQKSVAESLSSICRVTRLEGNELAVAELSRDWWPLALHWALEGEVGALAAVVVHPTSTEEVSQVMSVCHDAVIPVTAAGGRSGVCGGSIPVHGGVVIDLSEMNLIIEVDEVSGIVTAMRGLWPRSRTLPPFKAQHHRRAPPAKFRPVDCRRLGCLSGRRPIFDSIRKDRRDGGRPRGRACRWIDYSHRRPRCWGGRP